MCKSSSLLLSVTETISTAAIVGDYYVFLPVTKRDCSSSGGTPEYPLHATLLGHKKSQIKVSSSSLLDYGLGGGTENFSDER